MRALLTHSSLDTWISLVDDAPKFLHPTFKQGMGYKNFVRQQSYKQGQELQFSSFEGCFNNGERSLAEQQGNGRLDLKGATEVLPCCFPEEKRKKVRFG